MEISKKMAQIAKKMTLSFTFKGRPITSTEVFAASGLMPGLAKRADQLASLCLGYNLGASYQDDETALLGISVSFDHYTPDVLRLFCLLDVVNELARMSPDRGNVSMDELMYD